MTLIVALVVTVVLMIVIKVAMTLMIVLVVTITLMIAIKVAMILMITDCGDDEYMKIAIKGVFINTLVGGAGQLKIFVVKLFWPPLRKPPKLFETPLNKCKNFFDPPIATCMISLSFLNSNLFGIYHRYYW